MKKVIAVIVIYLMILFGFSGYKANVTAGNSVEIIEVTTETIRLEEDINENYTYYIEPIDIVRDTSALGGVYKKYYSKYLTYYAPNNQPIHIVAQDKVSDEQMLKAYNVLEFYLTQLKSSKKIEIANSMADQGAILVMPNGADGESDIPDRALAGQPLYAMETPTEGDPWYIRNNYEHRDASYEEILHMVHDYGIGTIQSSGADPDLRKMIYDATMNALPKDKSQWGKSGLWGYDSKQWLIELEREGSLEQEYLASVVDSYYGLWGAYSESDGGMWGIYIAKDRAEIETKDPMGLKTIQSILPETLTYMARISPDFEGTFTLSFDTTLPYTHKSQYLINARLTGDKKSDLTGNQASNILMGNSNNNTLDGLEGIDVVQLSGMFDEYEITFENEDVIVKDLKNRDGIDRLKNIEKLRFKDIDYDISLMIP